MILCVCVCARRRDSGMPFPMSMKELKRSHNQTQLIRTFIKSMCFSFVSFTSAFRQGHRRCIFIFYVNSFFWQCTLSKSDEQTQYTQTHSNGSTAQQMQHKWNARQIATSFFFVCMLLSEFIAEQIYTRLSEPLKSSCKILII